MPKFGGDLFSTIVARIDLLELFHLLVEFELRNLTFCTIRGGGKNSNIWEIGNTNKEYTKHEENKRIYTERKNGKTQPAPERH